MVVCRQIGGTMKARVEVISCIISIVRKQRKMSMHAYFNSTDKVPIREGNRSCEFYIQISRKQEKTEPHYAWPEFLGPQSPSL